MGTVVTPGRRMIYFEGSQFRSPTSEELIQRLGAGINFVNLYQHSEKQFFLNGGYNVRTPPQYGVDGLTFFQFNAEIIDVWMFVLVAGSSGTTELDLRYSASPGAGYASIFSTTPKITSAAGSTWIHVGSTIPNTTAPVISTVNVVAGGAIGCDLLQAQSGLTQNCGIVIHYRPR